MASVQKFRRAVMQAVSGLVGEVGGSCRIEQGGNHGHDHLVIEAFGKVRKSSLPTSPSADLEDAVRMKVCDVRRILRELKG